MGKYIYFWKSKTKGTLGMRTQESAYTATCIAIIMRMQTRSCARMVDSRNIKMQIFCINAEVWNYSQIVWKSFQTPIFSI